MEDKERGNMKMYKKEDHPTLKDKTFHELDKKIPLTATSAMFGPEGADTLRCGPDHVATRELGLGWLIYGFARVQKPKVVVEIGMGGSSICVLTAIKDNGVGHLWTCDCWPDRSKVCTDYPNNYPPIGVRHRFHDDGSPYSYEHSYLIDVTEMEELTEYTLHYGDGAEFSEKWEGPIDMILIDAGHGQEETLREWEGLAKWLVPGGYALLHDPLGCIGEVGMMLEAFMEKHKDYSMIIEPNILGMAIVQRKFTLNTYYMWFTAGLAQQPNPQGPTTPIHFTDPRKCRIIDKFDKVYFPVNLHEGQAEMFALSKELIDSGEPQTLDKLAAVDEYLEKKRE